MEKWYAICKEKGNSGWEVNDVVVFEKGSTYQMIPDEDNPISFTNKSFEDFARESKAEWKKLDTITTSEMEKRMTTIEIEQDLRALIKPCMLLVFKNGKFAKTVLTTNGIVIQYAGGGWDLLGDKLCEIEEVYGLSTDGHKISEFKTLNRVLIWKYKTEAELEIERLQYEIKEREERIRELKNENNSRNKRRVLTRSK